ncbi:MAG TPA: SPOR domain-containing protein, partial [Methylomirabilota bacterium]|nr:SPOR domain-containing protein [Methylomirabilota bacterium]
AGLPPLPSSEQVEAPAAEPEPLVAALESAVPPPVSDPVAALLPPVDVAPTPVAAETPTVAPIEVVPAPTAGAAPAPVLSPIADVPAVEVFPEAEAPVIVTDAPRPTPRPAVPAVQAAAPVAEVAAPPPVAAASPLASQDGPLDLTEVASLAPTVPATRSVAPAPEAAAPPPAEAPAATASAPAAAYVQLSSQRSEAAALQAFRGLQQKHPGLLGGLSPDVQRADLGAKGVYYRVRVGQPSGGDANGLCTQLKAAGSDCIIARR